jgi:uncharacterized repeat protein (TIGR03803 family)
LLGVTGAGGAYGEGTIFKIVPDGAASKQEILYSFCSEENCPDGARPMAGLTLDGSGNVFGTTSEGGLNGEYGGTVFSFDGSVLTTLHSFCALPDCADGAAPITPLTMDDAGHLYGVTLEAGGGHQGTAFEMEQ